MNNPVGSAVARRSRVAQRNGAEHRTRAGAHDVNGLGDDQLRREGRFEPEADENPAGVRGKLKPGTGFFEPLGFFQHHDADAFGRKGKSGR